MASLSIENVAGESVFVVCIQNGWNAQVLCGFGVAVVCGMILIEGYVQQDTGVKALWGLNMRAILPHAAFW